MRAPILILLLVAGCKGDKAPPAEPHVSKFPPLPAGPVATLDPPGTAPAFPTEQPAIVLWRGGGGDTPVTLLGVRVWADGTVRFKCNRRGKLPPERVTAMLETFARVGWTSPQPSGVAPTEPSCTTTSVQIVHAGAAHRENSSCNATRGDVHDAVVFVQSVVGPDPC